MSQDTFTFTVGKLDAGMAILLGERAHLIEFPSILLPPGATTGSIVNIAVHQNLQEEERRDNEFWALQDNILDEFGVAAPDSPKLELRNVTQTSVTLEWPVMKLATAKLRSLDIYRNGERLAAIPSPLTNTSTKLSGLELNTDYTFQLILRTTAGTFPSDIIRVHTHTITDTSGICVCFGNVQDEVLLENAKMALGEMRAKWSDKIQIDTTHFVCTSPASTPSGAAAAGNTSGAPGVEYQRALQLSIPVVQPHWILACHSEKKMMPIAAFYLGVAISPSATSQFTRPQSMSQASLPKSPASSPLPGSNRASMPPPSRQANETPPGNASSFVNGPSSPEALARAAPFPSLPEEVTDDETDEASLGLQARPDSQNRSRTGTMNKAFKFPSPTTSPTISDVPSISYVLAHETGTKKEGDGETKKEGGEDNEEKPASPIGVSTTEVPPPPPVEKEKSTHSALDDGDDEVGETVEIEL